jgi:hypothetical protein
MKMKSILKRDGLAIFIAVLGAVLVWLGTRQGAGVGGDATIYLTTAKNFVSGIGLGLINPDGTFRLIPYFPPFFPLVLSLFTGLHLDAAVAARWLHILLFGLTLYMVVRTTNELIKDWKFSLALGLLLAFSPVLVPAFSWVMSEPLSIFLGTLAILLLLSAFRKPDHKWALHVSALIAGLSILTRYGAIVYAATACILLLLFVKGGFLQRLGKAVVYGIESILPVGIWAMVDFSLTQTVSSRSIHSLAGSGARILAFFDSLKSVILFWLIPDSWIQQPFYPAWGNTLILVVFLILLVLGTWFFLKKIHTQVELYRLVVALVLFSVLYVFMTLFISLMTYPPITIGTRMFSPLHLMAFWLIVLIIYQFWKAVSNRKVVSTSILLGLILLVLWTGWRGSRIVETTLQNGLGFQSVTWQQSDLVAYVRGLPQDQKIVSNEEMALLYLTERQSYPLAEIYQDEPSAEFTMFGQAETLDEGQKQFKEHGAVLVLFDSIFSQLQGLYLDQANSRVEKLTDGLQLIYQGKDGAVYRYADTVEE